MRFSLESEDGHVDVLVFTDVSNAEDVRSQILTGTVQAALLDASLIPDVFLVLVATSNAMRKQREKAMSTRNVFTEIVYGLSSTRNISKSLQTFGISPQTKAVLAVMPQATKEQLAKVRELIRGTERELVPDALIEISDSQRIEKIHGISDAEKTEGSLVDAVATRMACRDIK